MRAVALALVLAACSKPPPPHEPAEVAVATVDAGAAPIATAGDAAATTDEPPPLEAGWVTGDDKTGRIDYVGRDKALAQMRRAKLRVLVKVSAHIEECSSMGGAHVFFVPAREGERPFSIAHLGGHGAHILLGKEPLYVASIETHPPGSFGNGRGWCLEEAPSYDGTVLAIVPVRSEDEGLRLLEKLH